MADNPLVEIKPVGALAYVKIPANYDYKMTSETVVDSARNSKGFVVATVIREGIRKIELKWNYLTKTEYSNLMQLFESKYNGSFFFYCKYFDEVAGNVIDSETDLIDGQPRMFYVGNRVGDVAKIKLDSSGYPIGYVGVTLSLIEV